MLQPTVGKQFNTNEYKQKCNPNLEIMEECYYPHKEEEQRAQTNNSEDI
jgi:hypothetical protein